MSHIGDPHQADTPRHSAYAVSPKVQPRAVHGRFRSLKWVAMAVLLAYWHLAPFLRWDRGPGAPDQAILLDITGRRAYFFLALFAIRIDIV